MHPVLMFFLVALGVFCFAGALLFFWARAKLRRGIRWLKVQALESGVDELRRKVGEPGKEPNPELEALLSRVIEAHDKAKAAYERGDLDAIDEVADPVLSELFERVKKKAEEEELAKQKALQDQPAELVGEPVALALPPAAEPVIGDKPAAQSPPAGQPTQPPAPETAPAGESTPLAGQPASPSVPDRKPDQ